MEGFLFLKESDNIYDKTKMEVYIPYFATETSPHEEQYYCTIEHLPLINEQEYCRMVKNANEDVVIIKLIENISFLYNFALRCSLAKFTKKHETAVHKNQLIKEELYHVRQLDTGWDKHYLIIKTVNNMDLSNDDFLKHYNKLAAIQRDIKLKDAHELFRFEERDNNGHEDTIYKISCLLYESIIVRAYKDFIFYIEEAAKNCVENSKSKRKKYPAKYYALYHWMMIEMGIMKQFELDENNLFPKTLITGYAEKEYKLNKGQGFYRAFIKINIKDRNGISHEYGKGYKEKIIDISGSDTKVIKYLKQWPNNT